MRRASRTIAAATTAMALLALAAVPAAADSKTSAVLKTELEGEPGTEANIVEFEVGPDWVTDRHIHPGHVFVYVTEGAIEIDVEGEEPRTVSAGEAFYERPDKPMVARTASAPEGAKFLVFQVGPTGEPIMVSQPE